MATPLGDRIKSLREKLGISQSELGRMVGLSRASISQYELGAVQEMKMLQLVAMSKALQVDPEELATGVPSARAAFQRSDISFVPLVIGLELNDLTARSDMFDDKERKFVATSLKIKNGFAVEITDDEMISSDSPFKVGGFVIFDADAQPVSGDNVLVKVAGLESPLFRSLRISGSRHILRPLNTQFQAIETTAGEYEVYGVAREFNIKI